VVNSRDLSDIEGTGDAKRPSKFRRLSDDSDIFAWLQEDQATPCASKGKKKKDDKMLVTPLSNGGNLSHRNDYSAFKGRGRYSGQIQYVQSFSLVISVFIQHQEC
jgi:hypothetical protein